MSRRKPATHTMKPETKVACLALYFKIEKHFAHGGQALTIRDVMHFANVTSTSTAKEFVNRLIKWGLLRHDPGTIRSIVLHPEHIKQYPQVIYADTLAKQVADAHEDEAP